MDVGQIVDSILRLPHGRAATWRAPALKMAELVAEGGDGDHLEIGVMHGATLIMAALVKREYGLSGKVVGVDPLKGYYPAGPMNPEGVWNEAHTKLLTRETDVTTSEPITPEVLWANIDHFGVRDRVQIVQDFSYPWPAILDGRRFVTAYIDGDHYREGPVNDWENVYPRTSKLIWLDDCSHHCPAVQRARKKAIDTPGWNERGLFFSHLLVMERAWTSPC